MENEMFSSKTPLSKLYPMTISQLNLNELAAGKYLLARVMEKFTFNISIICWSTVIDDPEGSRARFALYNYPFDETIYPGDLIAIKEPFFCSPNGNYHIRMVRCYSPTEVVVVRPSHPWYSEIERIKWQCYVEPNHLLTFHPRPTDLSQWMDRGKHLFSRGKLNLAREAYTICLRMFPDNPSLFKIIKLNFLALQLCLGYFEEVVEIGESFLQEFPQEYLAYFSLADAYYSLRHYQKTLETYYKYREKFGNTDNALNGIRRVRERIRESKGEFDFDNLRQISSENPKKEIDHADFCGPVIIMNIPGKGRGLVLTEDVSKGSVLVVSKALASVLNREFPGKEIAAGQKPDYRFCVFSVVMQLARLIMKNPNNIGTHVYDLYSGVNRTERPQLYCDPELNKTPIVDVELLLKIIAFNIFFIGDATQNEDSEFRACGLFLLPSYINHSCVPNVRTEFYNGVMVIKALKNMKEGTELTRCYVSQELSFEERTKLLVNGGFKCDCAKCERHL